MDCSELPCPQGFVLVAHVNATLGTAPIAARFGRFGTITGITMIADDGLGPAAGSSEYYLLKASGFPLPLYFSSSLRDLVPRYGARCRALAASGPSPALPSSQTMAWVPTRAPSGTTSSGYYLLRVLPPQGTTSSSEHYPLGSAGAAGLV